MARLLRFGRFEFDPHTLDLRREGTPVRLQPQPARVLALLLERPGRLWTRRQLQDEVWPDETSQITRDQGLNTCIRQVRDALGEHAAAPTYIETHRRRGYRFIAPVQVIEERQPAPVRRLFPPRLGAILAATALLLAVAVAFAASRLDGDRPQAARARAPTQVRLAVLPFTNLSGDPRQDIFVEGLTAEVTTRLAGLDPERIRVIAHTSTRRYRGSAKTVAEIGDELDVDYVLDGNVRSHAGVIRVGVQLIRASDQTHVWADQLDRPLESFLDLQRDIGRRLASSLGLPLAAGDEPAASGSKLSPQARLSYLKGRYLLGHETLEGAQRSVAYLREAVEIDPDFALAHALLAEALFWTDQRAAAERAARRALELEPNLAEAHVVLANIKLDRDFDWETARAHYEQAIAAAPGRSEYHHAFAHYLSAVGRSAEALERLALASDLDPLSPTVHGDEGWVQYWAGGYEAAAARCREAAKLMPRAIRARAERCALQALARLGRYEEAREHALHIMKLADADPAAIANASGVPAPDGLAAYFAWAVEQRNRATALGSDSFYALARGYADLGRTEDALRALERALETRPRGLVLVAVEPRFEALRGHPRFRRIVNAIGLPTRLAAGSG